MVDQARLREELKKMRALIQSDAAVRARFDTDGNGVIDGDEWEQVRKLVVARLEREDAERAAARSFGAGPAGDDDDVPVVVGSVASGIFERDLGSSPSSGTPSSGALTERTEVIVEETGLAPLLGSLVRRNYTLRSPDGKQIGEIVQREHEMLEQFKSGGFRPTLHFDVVDASGGRLTFRRDPRFFGDQVAILDATGGQVGHIETKFGILKPRFRVVSTFDRASLTVKWPLLHPFTLQILDPFDEPAGEIQRGWSGLGAFLAGANRLHIRVDPDKVPKSFMPSLVACAVLAEMGQEGSDKKASLMGIFGDD